MCFILFDVFNGCSVVKKSIGKGMSNIYYREKLMFSKLVGKVNFSERKFEEMHKLWRAKTGFGIWDVQSYVYASSHT